MRSSSASGPQVRHLSKQGLYPAGDAGGDRHLRRPESGRLSGVAGVLTSDEVARKKEVRLAQLQRAFDVLERDVSQMVPRTGRIEGENNRVLLAASQFGQQSDDWGMAFIRGLAQPGWYLAAIWPAPGRLAAQDHQLERLSYLYPDPVIGTEPRVQGLLDRVTGLRLFFYSEGLEVGVDPGGALA